MNLTDGECYCGKQIMKRKMTKGQMQCNICEKVVGANSDLWGCGTRDCKRYICKECSDTWYTMKERLRVKKCGLERIRKGRCGCGDQIERMKVSIGHYSCSICEQTISEKGYMWGCE